MELVAKVFDSKDRRFMALVVEPELFGDLFLNLGKIKVTGLPHDVKVQAMVYDPMRGVIMLRLWSSEFEVIDTGAAIPVCDGVRIERVPGVVAQKEASAGVSELNPWRYFRDDGNDYIRRVRRGEDGTIFYRSGNTEHGESLSFYLMNRFHEIHEDEAAKILGGRPWDRPADV